MRVSQETRCQLANNLQRLPAEQIKKAVIKMLSKENVDLIDWERSLSSEIDSFQEWVKSQRGKKP